jgi:hypothetical protein
MAVPEFKRIEELFHQAVARPMAERSAFLIEACAGDTALIAAVEALLLQDGTGDTFLMSPVAGAAAQHRQDAPTMRDSDELAATPAPPPTLPGYEILQELGRGGMGVVYRARQTRLNRMVAVKMLPSSAVTTEQLARFRLEAEALGRLNHPNIVTIYDVGEHDGRPYFVLEYVRGPSLAQVLASRPQDPLASAQLIETVARAMQAVHDCGIVHRDLKPANILLASVVRGPSSVVKGKDPDNGLSLTTDHGLRTTDFCPKVTDFGLAKDPGDDRKLTRTGATIGTPCYMAPEQATNNRAAIGPATDVYALGSILYEMLVGRPPFEAETALATLMRLLQDEPVAPASLRPGLPRDLVTICLKCLEKSPRRRYASAAELADDLCRFRKGEPIRARPIGAAERTYRWCRRRPLVAGLLGLIGALAVTFVVTVLIYNARLEAALQQQRRQIVQLNVQIGVTLLDSGDTFAALLRFAEALRLDEDSTGAAEHRRRIAATLEQCPQLTELLDLEAPVLGGAVTEKGGLIATVEADNAVAVWHVPARRRIATGLAHADRPTRAAFSADGRQLGTITADGTARIWDLTTGQARRLPAGAAPPVELLAFHPNGQLLLSEHAGAVVRVWDLTTPELTPVARDMKVAPVFAVPSADARWLFTADAGKHGQLWDVATGQPVGPAFALGDSVCQASISADGRRVAVQGTDRTIREWDAGAGRPIGKALRLTHSADTMALSMDGRRLLACDGGGAGRLWDVEAGQTRTPVLRQGGPLMAAAIDAAGERMVTVSNNGIVCFWALGKVHTDATARPIAELVALAQVHSGGYLDEEEVFRPLSAAQRRAAWETLRTR